MKTRLTVVLTLLAFGAVGLIAQGGMRPGRWETTMQMEMAGSPVQMPPMKQTRCVTPAEARIHHRCSRALRAVAAGRTTARSATRRCLATR